jgi:hypothetical protein
MVLASDLCKTLSSAAAPVDKEHVAWICQKQNKSTPSLFGSGRKKPLKD